MLSHVNIGAGRDIWYRLARLIEGDGIGAIYGLTLQPDGAPEVDKMEPARKYGLEGWRRPRARSAADLCVVLG